MLNLEALATRKGQVTVPIVLGKKYDIQEGMKVIFEDSSIGICLKVIPQFQDLIGADADTLPLQEVMVKIDKIRSEDRY
jgi:bifunctional DNA-binding transcriptional regulator/antitoxin component of YhaV-PrlF toxin-antitoxin module